jgi:hypothetical protein
MGHFKQDNSRDMGFPDEFGEEMYRQEQEETQKTAQKTSPSLPPFCGYVTPGWFGPFLLAPLSRRERGFC